MVSAFGGWNNWKTTSPWVLSQTWADVVCAWIDDAKNVKQLHKFADANKRSINLAKHQSMTSYESVINKLRYKKKELS